ncbi:hypothetical protein BC567DRAFT_74416 [Phyllosticta citribraziliensis]
MSLRVAFVALRLSWCNRAKSVGLNGSASDASSGTTSSGPGDIRSAEILAVNLSRMDCPKDGLKTPRPGSSPTASSFGKSLLLCCPECSNFVSRGSWCAASDLSS